MAKIKHFFIFLWLLQSTNQMFAFEEPPPLYLQYVREITRKFGKEIEEDLNLSYCGHGGSMPYTVNSIEVLFTANRKVSVEEARMLEITCTERLINAVNSHEKMKKCLILAIIKSMNIS